MSLQDHVPQTFLWYIVWALGVWGPILLAAAAASVIMAVVLVKRGRGPMAAAGLLLAVHVPLLVGIFGAVWQTAIVFAHMSMGGTAPQPRGELPYLISRALLIPWAALILMVPGYVTALVGGIVQALRSPELKLE